MSVIDLAPRKASRKLSDDAVQAAELEELDDQERPGEDRAGQQADHHDLHDQVGVHEHADRRELAVGAAADLHAFGAWPGRAASAGGGGVRGRGAGRRGRRRAAAGAEAAGAVWAKAGALAISAEGAEEGDEGGFVCCRASVASSCLVLERVGQNGPSAHRSSAPTPYRLVRLGGAPSWQPNFSASRTPSAASVSRDCGTPFIVQCKTDALRRRMEAPSSIAARQRFTAMSDLRTAPLTAPKQRQGQPPASLRTLPAHGPILTALIASRLSTGLNSCMRWRAMLAPRAYLRYLRAAGERLASRAAVSYGERNSSDRRRSLQGPASFGRCRQRFVDDAKGGAWGRIRTTDTRIFNPLLYQLSYPGAPSRREGRLNARRRSCPARRTPQLVRRLVLVPLHVVLRVPGDGVAPASQRCRSTSAQRLRAERAVVRLAPACRRSGTGGHAQTPPHETSRRRARRRPRCRTRAPTFGEQGRERRAGGRGDSGAARRLEPPAPVGGGLALQGADKRSAA